MPKRTDISSILIIGAGPIVIGQACEFDYSGVQACKALRAEGYRIVLVNSNPATIMTDPDVADATYIEPITPGDGREDHRQGAARRPAADHGRPDGAEHRPGAGRLRRAGEVRRRDDRRQGRRHRQGRGPPEIPRRHGHDRAWRAPSPRPPTPWTRRWRGWSSSACRRSSGPSFTLAGTGGGIAYNVEEFREIVERGLDLSPTTEVLIEESVLGWKEYEMEVVRDKADNCIIVCSIENIDPMGVHTGDSHHRRPGPDPDRQGIPAHARAPRSRCCARSAWRPAAPTCSSRSTRADGRMVVIEMNPRVSRSSALASKATGFPIAKVAARLAVGYTLDELMNDITGATPASFEPTIDYVVTKIPRFAFEKYPGSEPLPDHLDEVGGRGDGHRPHLRREPAEGAARPGDRPLRPRRDRDRRTPTTRRCGHAAVLRALGQPTPDRLRVIAQAFRHGLTSRRSTPPAPTSPGSCARSRPWCAEEARVRADGLPDDAAGLPRAEGAWASPTPAWRTLTGPTEARGARRAPRAGRAAGVQAHRHLRRRVRAPRRPTCTRPTRPARSARRRECESEPSDRKKAIILGGGPNRIGQGIEFDYCCCHAAFALDEIGVESIMVNCNPETVSTDYDTSDRLYFEPLTAEDVLELIEVEQSNGRAAGRDRPVRRPDAAEAGPAAGGRRRADPRHHARRHRPGRGPRALPAAAAPAEHRPADQRHRPHAATRPSPAPTRSATRW